MKTHVLFVLLFSALCLGQTALEPQAESLASCSVAFSAETLRPYDFAKAALASLWYARNGAERGNEIKQVSREADNMFTFLTGMMRITKLATNDYYCAKRSVRPFAANGTEEHIRTASRLFMAVYDAHISINQRTIELLKDLNRTEPADLMDKISTLQVERSQRWSDLVPATTMALLMLVDLNRTDVPGKTTRLIITKAEKEKLLNWIDSHFPEFKNGTPKESWSDPAKTVEMYFMIFKGRKCADE